MEFFGKDPGAVFHGNFINYYKFNSAEDRLKLLPREVWLPTADDTKTTFNQDSPSKPYFVLDVGCNCGDLTQLLHSFLTDVTDCARPVHILGVDIDETLIERAQLSNQQSDITFASLDIMTATGFEKIQEFLRENNRDKFDAVCCFSITMWIHLNHHDKGLQQFLSKLASLAELFVLEPQPWRCYGTAERRLRKAARSFPLLPELKWRTNVEQDIQSFMEESLKRRKVFECCPTDWNRRICFYR